MTSDRSLKENMLSALRLTRDGKLKEALATLRGATQQPPPIRDATTPAPDLLQGTVASLRKLPDVLQTGLDGLIKPPSPALPAGACFEERHFTGEAGHRDYKLYIPSNYNGDPLPLLVMLHGCTQSPDDFALGTRMNQLAEQKEMFVAYPAQSRLANMSKCWNWFKPEDQKRGHGEPAIIAGIVQDISRDVAVQSQRVYAAGLSAGGALAVILAATYPDMFAAIGVHSGLPYGAASDMPSAAAAMRAGSPHPPAIKLRPPLIIFHGDQDNTVSPANATQIIAQCNTTGLRQLTKTSPAYTKTTYTDPQERPMLEYWALHGAGHAWSGGSQAGTFTNPTGPDASTEMLRFFTTHTLTTVAV
jgi:poly(hydroxyalkanoate) depolymerase family esterase